MPSKRPATSRRSYLALAATGLAQVSGCVTDSETAEDATKTDRTSGMSTPGSTEDPTETDQTSETPDSTEEPAGESDIQRMEDELATVSFEGEYFDTHAHWMELGNSIPSDFAEHMRSYDIGATVLFSPSLTATLDYRAFLEALTDPGVDYLPFMGAPPPNGRNLSADSHESLYTESEGVFYGIGEWKHRDEQPPLTDDPMASLFELAGQLDVPVMYHPYPEQIDSIEPAMSRYSDTTFLIHSAEILGMGTSPNSGTSAESTDPETGVGLVSKLLEEHDNFYWQADVASMMDGMPFRQPDASAYLDWYDSNANQRMDWYGGILQEFLDIAPEQVVWGTDVAYDWHMDDEVMATFMEFTEGVLERVPEKHHAAYKRENALAVFGL